LGVPKISVIIPVYNAEQYLRRCLDSVCNQTLKEIEIICIDDCSSDDSAQILAEYATNYKNLLVKHLEKNQGESAARNIGLSLAKGEYLAFVDNDDEVDLNFCEKLYEKAQETAADIVKGQTIEIGYNGAKHLIKQLQKDNPLLFIVHWWSGIYKRSLIIDNNISFSINHILGGDLLFLNQAVIAAQSLKSVEAVHYHYYRREDSGDSKILSKEKIISALNIYEIITDNINSNKSKYDLIYKTVFHHFILWSLYLGLKGENLEAKRLCVDCAFKIFEKCQDEEGLQKAFAKTAPNIFSLIKNGDRDGIEKIVINSKSSADIIISGLRARIKLNN